jgi:hypothetical protein
VQIKALSNKFQALEIRFLIFLFDFFFTSFGVVSFDNVPKKKIILNFFLQDFLNFHINYKPHYLFLKLRKYIYLVFVNY